MKTFALRTVAAALCLVLACAASSHATNFYVRPDGNNANTGTSPDASGAWASIDFAVDSGLASGDVVYVMPGTYNESITCNPLFGVQLIGDTNGAVFGTPGKVTVQAPANSSAFQISDSVSVSIEGFRFLGVSGRTNVTLFTCSTCNVSRCEARGGDNGFVLSSCTDCALHNLLVVQAGFTGINLVGTTDIEVANCTLVNCARDGLNSGFADGTVVRNCILVGNGDAGLRSTGSAVTHSHNLYFNNIVADQVGVTSDPTDVFVNPLFVDTIDFRLQETSPAVDAGTDLSANGVTQDLDGDIRPRGAGFDIGCDEYRAPIASNGKTILFVRRFPSSLTVQEQLRITQFENWGYTVTTIEDIDSQANFNAAIQTADVVYVSEEAHSTDIGTKLRGASIGVITEESDSDDEFGFATSNGTGVTTSTIEVTDDTHAITRGLPLGVVAITDSDQDFSSTAGVVAPGARSLALVSGAPVLFAVEVGDELANSTDGIQFAPARRVRMPFGRNDFDWDSLTVIGLTLVRQAIEWAETDGLIAHWKLDEETGTVAADSSGCGRDGVYVNTPAPSTQALRGRGIAVSAGDRIDTGNFAVTGSEITLSAWFFIENFSNDARIIIRSSGNNGGAGEQSWGLIADDNGRLEFRLATGGAIWVNVFNAANVLKLNRWHHAVGTYDGAEVRIYLDGRLVATSPHSPGGFVNDDSTHEVTIGDSVTGGRPFNGLIDEVRVYNRALSAAEVSGLYGLVGHYRLDETSGTTAVDSSGLNNHGTHVNSPNTGVPAIREQGVEYNGADTDDYTSLPHTLLDGKTTVSVAWWMQTTSTGNTVILSGANSTFDNELLLQWQSDNSFRPMISNNVAIHNVESIATGQWRHYVYCHDRLTGVERLYCDGRLVVDAVRAPVTTEFQIEENGLILAQEQDGVGSGFDATETHVGLLDDVRVYDRLLNDQEVAEIHGLLGHWTFDEGSGSDIADSTLMRNHASFLVGSPQWVTGRDGGALEFDGGSDAITAEDFDPPAIGAVVFWMRSNGPPASRQRPFGVGDAFEAYQDTGGLLILDVSITGPPDTFGPPTPVVDDGQWYHIVANFNSDTDEVETYLNGVLVQSEVYPADITDQPANRLSFGTRTGSTNYFNGVLDDFRIYNRWLSAAEVATLFRRVSDGGTRVIGWTETR